jgi:hypothetical protein
MAQPRSLSVKSQRMGTTCPCIERSDQSILKFSGAAPECNSSIKDLLLVLNFKRVRGEKILEMRSDLGRIPPQEAAQDPNNFEHSSQANEPRVLFAQFLVDDLVGLARLLWVILEQIAQDHVGIQTNHLAAALRRASLDCNVHFLNGDRPV